MKNALFALMLVSACGSNDAAPSEAPAEAPKQEAPAAPAPAPVAEPAAEAAPPPADLPVVEDFEAEVAQEVSAANYKNELKEVEKEIEATN